MTEENYKYRINPLFLRNEFDSTEEWSMPVIPKPQSDITINSDLRLLGFDRAKTGKDNHYNRAVHFFLYDYKFEDIWEKPQKYIETLKKYKAGNTFLRDKLHRRPVFENYRKLVQYHIPISTSLCPSFDNLL